jgi:branched-chain amino acid transport system substrate-binding protein
MKLTRRDFAAGIAAGIAAPHIISSIAKAQGATIKIGMCAPVTGPAAESGGYAIKGAKLALEAVNKAGGVLGKQLELIVEDDQTTNPGIVLAFSKLAAQPDIVAFVGSIRSTQVHAMAPDVLKLGKPVMIGGTDPNLTHMGNQWLFRFRPNDSYSGRVIADYGVNTLGKKKWAVLHSTDAFGTAGGKALSSCAGETGCACRTRPGLRQSEPGLHAGRARHQAVGRRHPWLLLHLRKRSRHLCPPVAPAWRQHSLGRLALDRQHHCVEARRSRRSTIPMASPIMPKTAAKLQRRSASSIATAVKVAPDNQSSWPFDAVTVLAAAINKAGSTDATKIREAILATKKFPGAEGEYNFDQNGDGLHGYNIVKNEKGSIVFDKHIEFND